jgi:hypothetical protein
MKILYFTVTDNYHPLHFKSQSESDLLNFQITLNNEHLKCWYDVARSKIDCLIFGQTQQFFQLYMLAMSF